MTDNSITEILPLDSRIHAFAELGKIMGRAADSILSGEQEFWTEYPVLQLAVEKATHHNSWFTPSNIAFSFNAWKEVLHEEMLREWLKSYELMNRNKGFGRIAVIMAGNIPLVGFHDFLSVLISGHRFIGKLSTDDKIILPAIAEVLIRIDSRFRSMIQFTETTLNGFDAIIATGSNNTARYFEYYFSKYPHIIRKNRSGVGVLSGNENEASMLQLGSDICTYFGLGCRNISKVFIPEGFRPEKLFAAIEPYAAILGNHNKYMNNYSYHRSVFLLNNTRHLDNGVFILTESNQYSSPIPVLYYEYYSDMVVLREKLKRDDEFIQCIANEIFTGSNTTPLGKTQHPGLGDYADGIDTMKFLNEL